MLTNQIRNAISFAASSMPLAAFSMLAESLRFSTIPESLFTLVTIALWLDLLRRSKHGYRPSKWGCRLAWSRLVASGAIDEDSNSSSPTISCQFSLHENKDEIDYSINENSFILVFAHLDSSMLFQFGNTRLWLTVSGFLVSVT